MTGEMYHIDPVARWESRGGKDWVDLFKGEWGYHYSGRDCGGSLGGCITSDAQAVSAMQERIDQGGYQADANKTPMRRTA